MPSSVVRALSATPRSCAPRPGKGRAFDTHGHQLGEVLLHRGAAAGDLEAHARVGVVRVGAGQLYREALGGHIEAFGDDGGEAVVTPWPISSRGQ